MVDYILNECREGTSLERDASSEVLDDARLEINAHLVAIGNGFGSFSAFEDWQPDVDGIAVEDSREARCDDARNTVVLDYAWSMLTR